MGTQGSFGYKIGRKVRLMHVQYDADMLWQTCVREIYVLIKHYGSVDLLREAFEGLKEAKNKPKPEAIEKCKPYIDLTGSYQSQREEDWYCLTRNCQHSFINILDAGYMLNNGKKLGLVFLLDFNTKSVRFFGVNHDKTEHEYETATIDEIMEFDEMPTKSMTEILTETKTRAQEYYEKLKKIDEQTEELRNLSKKTREITATQDIIKKTEELIEDMEWQRIKIEMKYRYFYHRLDSLNLINHDLDDS